MENEQIQINKWEDCLRADIMKQACIDYRQLRTTLYGIELGVLKYNDQELFVEKCKEDLEQIKEFIITDDYHVLEKYTGEDILEMLDEDFEKNKDKYLNEN